MSSIDFTTMGATVLSSPNPLSFATNTTDEPRVRSIVAERLDPGVSLNPQQIAFNAAVDEAVRAEEDGMAEALQPAEEVAVAEAPAEKGTVTLASPAQTTEERIQANIDRWCQKMKQKILEIGIPINPNLRVEVLEYNNDVREPYEPVRAKLSARTYDVVYVVKPMVSMCLVKFIGAPLVKQAVSNPAIQQGYIEHKGKTAIAFFHNGLMARLHYMDLFDMYANDIAVKIDKMVRYVTAVTLFNIEPHMYSLANERIDNAKRNLQIYADRVKTRLQELERANHEFIEAERAVAAASVIANVDNTVKRDIEELKKLMPSMYTSFTYENNEFIGKTNTIYIVHEGRKYRMGEYSVKINFKTNSLRIFGGNCRNSAYQHPHVTGQSPCLGNIGTAVSQMLRDGKIYGLYHTLHFFLASYNPQSPYIRIEQFPEEPNV